ncbi:MAG TPA: cytochrome c [Prolixibacteraceae bacterium]|jgi:mono/diheme cytochrome c family protein
MIKKYLFLVLIVLISSRISAQEWVVPKEDGAKLSPFEFNETTRKMGEELYNTNCKSCHGDPGKNNVINLVPPPPDVASVKMQSNSDGALHYKLVQGRAPMPSFKNILTSTDIWRVVSFIRSFNDKYVQVIDTTKIIEGKTASNVKILVTWVKEKNQVQTVISGMMEKKVQPIAGAEIKLFAKRYFGNLLIDEARKTDAQGKALFNFPKDLPGDSTGFVQLSAKLTDEAAFGEAKTDTSLAIGVPTYRPPLNEQRAMWNVVQKTPIWLLLAYIFTVLTVWGFIFYVIVQIRAIYRAGIKKEHETVD